MTRAAALWEEYHDTLRAFIRRRVADESAVDDILQNVFVKIHGSLSSLRDQTRLRAWLYRIARNAIVDYFRTHQPAVETPESLPQPEKDDGDAAVRELSACLRPMIRELPEGYREAVTLSELDGLTQQQVAMKQGLSLSGAKSRVQRGRAMLKTMLAECCRLEFDHQGRLCGYERKDGGGDAC